MANNASSSTMYNLPYFLINPFFRIVVYLINSLFILRHGRKIEFFYLLFRHSYSLKVYTFQTQQKKLYSYGRTRDHPRRIMRRKKDQQVRRLLLLLHANKIFKYPVVPRPQDRTCLQYWQIYILSRRLPTQFEIILQSN
jgi:hypothetical protein